MWENKEQKMIHKSLPESVNLKPVSTESLCQKSFSHPTIQTPISQLLINLTQIILPYQPDPNQSDYNQSHPYQLTSARVLFEDD